MAGRDDARDVYLNEPGTGPAGKGIANGDTVVVESARGSTQEAETSEIKHRLSLPGNTTKRTR